MNKPANDNSRNYRRKPYRESKFPKPEPRDVYAWQIDSSLDPSDEASWEVVGFG